MLGIPLLSDHEGIGSSPARRYPVRASNKVPCLARTSNHVALHSPWVVLRGRMGHARDSHTRSKCNVRTDPSVYPLQKILNCSKACYIVNLIQIFAWASIGVAVLPGVISFLAGLLMWVTSLSPVRKQQFELFLYTHQLYIIFVVFFALHVGDFIFSMSSAGIFLFMIDRFLRFCQSRRTVKVVSATSLPGGTVELVFSKPSSEELQKLYFFSQFVLSRSST